jgi:hypothetical protein
MGIYHHLHCVLKPKMHDVLIIVFEYLFAIHSRNHLVQKHRLEMVLIFGVILYIVIHVLDTRTILKINAAIAFLVQPQILVDHRALKIKFDTIIIMS